MILMGDFGGYNEVMGERGKVSFIFLCVCVGARGDEGICVYLPILR